MYTKEIDKMWKIIESALAEIAVFAWTHNWTRFASFVDRLGWRAFDRCPEGYKGTDQTSRQGGRR